MVVDGAEEGMEDLLHVLGDPDEVDTADPQTGQAQEGVDNCFSHRCQSF